MVYDREKHVNIGLSSKLIGSDVINILNRLIFHFETVLLFLLSTVATNLICNLYLLN